MSSEEQLGGDHRPADRWVRAVGAIAVLVLTACGGSDWAAVEQARASAPDATELTLELDYCDAARNPAAVDDVVESPTEIRVRVDIPIPSDDRDDCIGTAIVRLSSAIGQRAVVDDRTGRRHAVDFGSTAMEHSSTTMPIDSATDTSTSPPLTNPFPMAVGATMRVTTEPVSGPDREFVLRVTITNETGSTVETQKGLLINPSSSSTWDGALRVGATTADDPSLICGPNCDDVELVLLRIEAGSSVTLSTRLSALEPGAEYRVALIGIRFVATDGTATYASVIGTFTSPA